MVVPVDSTHDEVAEVRPRWSVLVQSYDELSSQQLSTVHVGSEIRVAFMTESANVSCMDTL
jgi:hypothetical protein